MYRLVSLAGLLVMVALAYGLSINRKKIQWRPVVVGVILQLLIGLFVLKTVPGRSFFDGANRLVMTVIGYADEGAEFLFGALATGDGIGYVFACRVLPTIVFIAAISGILYHTGVMQKVVQAFAWVMVRLMKTSGAESLCAAANVFAGCTEAPLIVRPYIGRMTRSELMALMSGGFATIAGSMILAYAGMGVDAGHMLAASLMSAPAALVCAKLMMPETEVPETRGKVRVDVEKTTVNVMDAATEGASAGLKLALNIGAMLIAFIALIAMANGVIGWVGGLFGLEGLTCQKILGVLLSPLAWVMGIPGQDVLAAGALLGEKTILNEFVAYAHLQQQVTVLAPRTVTILTYALCGFSNIGNLAIQIGGIGTLAPERRGDLAKVGLRALVAGALACMMTACVAGLLI